MPRTILRRCLSLLAGYSLSVCALSAENTDFWKANYPNLVDPTAESRPKARTHADETNIRALADAGFGSAEIGIDFRADPAGVRDNLRRLLETSRSLGFQIDLAPGGGQPYATPGIDAAGSMQQLVTHDIALTGPTDYEWTVQQPSRLAGKAQLVGLSAARVVDGAASPVTLDAATAVDLTPSIDTHGTLHWHVPAGHWRLFSYWQRATGQIAGGNPFVSPDQWSQRPLPSDPTAILTADIFSARGITSALAWLDQNVLVGDDLLLRGGDFAHDSLEVQAEMFWTTDLPAEFLKRRGYSLLPYLPAVYTPKAASFNPLDPRWGGPSPARPYEFVGDTGERVRYDYDRTLTDLYCDRYLNALAQWAHHKGMTTRVQVAYNYAALDMLRSARCVDIVENESFDSAWSKPFDASLPAYGTDRWRHMLDSYRLTGSGAHLANRWRATIEYGDDFAIYRKQPIDYMQQLNEALAGGITQGLLSGFAGAETAWPVPQGLAAIGLGDEWSAAWPQWRDWRSLNEYFARATQLLESGKPAVDAAIYHDRGLSTVHDDAPLYADGTLEGAGYTYDFIDPASLLAMEAADKLHKPANLGASYRVLILDNQPSLPADVARAILKLARHGLIVVIVGAAPAKSTGFFDRAANDTRVKTAMAALEKLPSVIRRASRGEVAPALREHGHAPAATFGDHSPLLSVHRIAGSHELWWIFNPGNDVVTADAALNATGVPYEVDLWSGRATRVAQWAVADRRLRLPLTVMPHQARVVLVRHDESAPLHALPVAGAEVVHDGKDFVVVAATSVTVPFSDGTSHKVLANVVPAPLPLLHWHLHVDEVAPDGAHAHDMDVIDLQDWRQIPELKDVAGGALYTTEFILGAEWFGSERATFLSVGDVQGAMQLMVNDHPVTAQSVGQGRWLVGEWLKPGVNSVAVRVDTTLLNHMVALRDGGDARYRTGPTAMNSAPSGLLGPVVLTSAVRVTR